MRRARELKVPVLNQDFIFDSIHQNRFVDHDQYVCGSSERNDKFKKGKIEGKLQTSKKKSNLHYTYGLH